MTKVLVDKKEKWERVNDKNDMEVTQRLKVFGGWLVTTHIEFERTLVTQWGDGLNDDQYTISQSFIPDPNHEWEI